MNFASSFFTQSGEAAKQVPKETIENAFELAADDGGNDTKASTYQRSMYSGKFHRPSAAVDMRDDGERSARNLSVQGTSIAADAQDAFISYDAWKGTTENAKSVRSLDRGGVREGDKIRESDILSPSQHQWESTSIVTSKVGTVYPEQEVQMTENECLMRIASMQQEIECLKLEIDKGHDKLRSLGDFEESAKFIKERVGGNRWAIEGMAAPHCTSTEIDCGEDDDLEVSIRDCHGDIQFGFALPVQIKVKGRSRRICVSRSKYVYLTIESCSLELVLVKCENITIVCGGHAPKIIAEDTHHVNISLCLQLMVEDIVQLRCSNIVLTSCDRQGIP